MKTAFEWMLAGTMLFTGTLNTISIDGADKCKQEDIYGNVVSFNHPFVQTLFMFTGEFLCLLAYFLITYRARARKIAYPKPTADFPFYVLSLPALCDSTGSSLQYVGLTLTTASAYQMLRAAVVPFTGLLSCLVLKREIKPYRWLGIAFVAVGTIVVGCDSLVCKSIDNGGGATNPLLGNAIIVGSQVIVASQMVIEESMIRRWNIPALMVVGTEGMFGIIIMSIVCTIFYFIHAPPALCGTPPDCDHLEDPYDAFYQMGQNWKLLIAMLGNVFSIAFYNWSSVSVTKHMNAVTRMVLDSSRTVLVWGISLALGWESFCWVQLVGFVILVAGMVIYNAIVRVPGMDYEEDADEKTDKRAPSGSIQVADGAGDQPLLAGAEDEDQLALDSPVIGATRTFRDLGADSPALGRMAFARTK